MYRVRTSGYRKGDPVLRWALPDRVFFACGACHILAAAHLDRFDLAGAEALAILPTPGFTGSHVVVAGEDWVFDYHGYSGRAGYFAHAFAKARRWWPGWDAAVMPIRRAALTSEAASREVPGLWLREPDQFLHDAMPRARGFLDRFAHPPAPIRLRRGFGRPNGPLTLS